MTLASTTAAAAMLPRPRLWGVGRYDVAGQPVYFEMSWADWQRDTNWARAMLADHGVGAGSGLIVVGGMPEAPWFDPVETAARELGAPFSIGEIWPFEAFRTAMYARRLPITMIFGMDRTVTEGLGEDLAGVLAREPAIGARPDAVDVLSRAGAQPFLVARLGPALAVECPYRTGGHINGAEWRLAERGGELFLTTAGPRAHRVSHGALGLRGALAEGQCACGRAGQRVTVTG